jgi:hypothetical protein
MLAGEMWTSEAENGCHLGRRNVHGQQFSREPQIEDAPVRLGKALANMPMLHPALIDVGSSLDRNRTRGIAYWGRRFMVSVGSCAATCVAQRSKSWAALARTARASTILTQGA